VVLALARCGVPVGFEVACVLEAPLDLVLVHKIGAPFQPEVAVGAVVDGGRPETIINQEMIREFQIPQTYIAKESARQLKEIERRRELYLAGRTRAPVEGRTAIVVDDGIATGVAMEAALHATREAGPKRLVLATPVAAGYDRAAACTGPRDRLPRDAQAVRRDRRVLRGFPAGGRR
jgi:putative phosphoribosyl transferase